MAEQWRVGRSVGRTVYRQVGDEASKRDELIGVMDTRELAGLVVMAVNHSHECWEFQDRLQDDNT